MEALTYVRCEQEVVFQAANPTVTIRCYDYPALTANATRPRLSPDRELTAEAMKLLMRLDNELIGARADWNEDRFRRLMRLRLQAVSRLRTRWNSLDPLPRIPLGSLRRRYHASLS